jgi:hypothetical protein
MAKRHTMTARRKAALHKAQIASARKRKGRGRRVAKAVGKTVGSLAVVYAAGVGGAYATRSLTRHKSQKKVSYTPQPFPTSLPKNVNFGYGNPVRTRAMKRAQATSIRRMRARSETRSRQLRKASWLGMYNAGLPRNVGGHTFVAGKRGTYRR